MSQYVDRDHWFFFPLNGSQKVLTLQIPEITGRQYHRRKSQAKLEYFCNLHHDSELSCCPVLCPPGSWVWVCGHLAPLFVWFKWVSAGSALPCFPGCKLTPPSLVWCVSGKHMTSGNGQGKGMKSKLSAQALGLKDKVLECLLIEYAWSLLKFLSSIHIHSHVQTCTHMCVICGLLVKTRRLWGMHLSFGGG